MAAYSRRGPPQIPIKKYTGTTTRTLADTTDTGDYNQPSDMLWESQIPAKLCMELDVEGNYRLNQTSSTFLATLFSGANAVAVVLGLDAGDLFGHGNFDISDFTLESPSDEVISFTCKMKLNGTFTAGS